MVALKIARVGSTRWPTMLFLSGSRRFLGADIVVRTDLNEILEVYSVSSRDLVYFDTSLSMACSDEAIPEKG